MQGYGGQSDLPSPVSHRAALVFFSIFDAMRAAPFFRRRAAPRRHSYTSRSNQTRKLKTPGGKLVVQYTAKKAKGPQTPAGDQGRIHGVRAL